MDKIGRDIASSKRPSFSLWLPEITKKEETVKKICNTLRSKGEYREGDKYFSLNPSKPNQVTAKFRCRKCGKKLTRISRCGPENLADPSSILESLVYSMLSRDICEPCRVGADKAKSLIARIREIYKPGDEIPINELRRLYYEKRADQGFSTSKFYINNIDVYEWIRQMHKRGILEKRRVDGKLKIFLR